MNKGDRKGIVSCCAYTFLLSLLWCILVKLALSLVGTKEFKAQPASSVCDLWTDRALAQRTVLLD